MLFGKFCLLERVSVGGMAEVFRAKPLGALDPYRYFAVKRILPHLAEDEDFITMFIDEARLTVQLRHPNVVQNYELGQFQSSYYIVMEFIAGKDLLSLQKHVRKEKTTVDIDMACHIMREIARGLDYVHQKTDVNGRPLGIIHRDISPQNILVGWDGKVKVIDFGIAKAASQSTHTQAGVLKGKYGYMSPEQVRGKDIDRRSDIFSMGTLFWELLTNRRLFKASNQYEVLTLIGDPVIHPPSAVNPAISPEVDAIAMRALAPEREDRYQSAGEFARDLHGYLKNQKPPYHRSQLTTWLRRAFQEDFLEEEQKREEFSKINTAVDVRRLFDEKYKPVSTDEDEEHEESTKIWDVDVLPDANEDIEAYVAEHTVVQAGGLELYGLVDESEVIADDEADFAYGEWDEVPDTLDEKEEMLSIPKEKAGLHFGSEPVMIHDDFADQKTMISRPATATMTVDRQRLSRHQDRPPQPASPGLPNELLTPIPQSRTAQGDGIRFSGESTKRLLLAVAALTLVGFLILGTLQLRQDGDAAKAETPQFGALILEVSPASNLEVFLNSGLIGQASPLSLEGLNPGTYDLKVRHPDFPEFGGIIEIPKGGVATRRVDLRAPGWVDFRFQNLPETARFYLNGVPLEQTTSRDGTFSLRRELPRGAHLLEGLADGMRPIRKEFVVEAGEDLQQEIFFESRSRFRVQGSQDQEVFLNQRSFGTPPLAWPDMNPRELYRIRIDDVETVLGYPELGAGQIDAGKLREIAGRSEEDYGWLVIDTGESWWHLIIDGIDSGLTTPIREESRIPVFGGNRVITLKRGTREYRYTVAVIPGETSTFRHR